jgi:hypothetical protein
MADNCSTQPLLLFTSASGDYVILVDLKLKIEMVQPIFVPKPKLKRGGQFYWLRKQESLEKSPTCLKSLTN